MGEIIMTIIVIVIWVAFLWLVLDRFMPVMMAALAAWTAKQDVHNQREEIYREGFSDGVNCEKEARGGKEL